jgi:hypothetical protein
MTQAALLNLADRIMGLLGAATVVAIYALVSMI